AFYGAIMTIPAYFLGKEFSDWKAGAISAAFMGTIPAALRRTMAGFYDTDALVLFFTLLTMYFIARSFKKRDWLSYSLTIVSMVLFNLTWMPAWYVMMLAIGATFVYLAVLTVVGKEEWKIHGKKKDVMPGFTKRLHKSISPFLSLFVPVIAILIISVVAAWLLGRMPFDTILNYVGFATSPSQLQIVNISVAELQNLNIFGGAWQELFSRVSVTLVFFLAGSILLLKRSKRLGALLFTWTIFTFFFITRGIRFMLIFAPAVSVSAGVAFSEISRNLKEMGSYAPMISFGFLAALLLSLRSPGLGVALATGLAIVMFFLKNEEKMPEISKPVLMATAVLAVLIVMSQGIQLASEQQGSPMSSDWEEAYEWMKYETSEDAVIGTWWDPGHRINGIAQRRNIADGAHCLERDCDPGLNTRISHLGKILVTKDEDEAVELLKKYQADASEIYWIASQDLIGKYQWPQYFGTGCESGDPDCPLYSQMRLEDQGQEQLVYQGGVTLQFQNDSIVPVYETEQGKGTFSRMLYYDQPGQLKEETFEGQESVEGTLWIHPQYSSVVYIPPFQEDSVFTKMFFEEGQGLEHFEKAFENDYMNIYQLNETASE
ncbi:MAG: STT3 domain-containing protein, partial [Candidatus Aenigmatarchaeota archaeon]